jgi:hypothetical protein
MSRPPVAGEVVALSGRRPDAPGAAPPRFPPANAERVGERIRELLRASGAGTLVASAACGADLLGLAAAGELGLRRVVVLPFEAERFRRTSVTDRPGDWGPLFDAVVAEVRARGDLVVLEVDGDDHDAYAAAVEAILDQAAERAGGRSADVRAVVVWDGAPRGSDDFTAAFAASAGARGMAVQHVSTLDAAAD